MDKDECMVSVLAALRRYDGVGIEDDTLQEAAKDPHSWASFARSTLEYENDLHKLTANNIDPQSTLGKGLALMDKGGIPAGELLSIVRNPDALLGEGVIQRVNQVYTDFIQQHGFENRAAWETEAMPVIRALADDLVPTMDPMVQHYAHEYFQANMKGVDLFGPTRRLNPIEVLAKNVVGNLVTWNPVITALNAFEFLPKALAYSVERGQPMKVFEALATVFNKTGGQFWKRIPELEALGVYGTTPAGRFQTLTNLLDVTENPLRAASYYLGESIQPGGGLDALEKVAFVYRFGNTPKVLWSRSGQSGVALMRYSIAQNKMLIRLLAETMQGNKMAAAALASFSAMQAVQTGGASVIPSPILGVAPELRDTIAEFDERTGLNIAKRAFGLDLTDKVAPLGVPALGVGFNILQTDIKATGSALKRAGGAAIEGDFGVSIANVVEAGFAFGQLGRIKGINLSTKRLVSEIRKAVEGEIAGLEDVPGQFVEDLGVLEE